MKETMELRSYIANLPVGSMLASAGEADSAVNTIDIDGLPDGIVTGSNLIQFPSRATSELKSSVALSLLAAQRVASNDPVIASPAQWLERHNTVLQNLNWRVEGGGTAVSEFKTLNAAVHEAIIPFITAALGGAAAASLIVTALEQMKKMDKDSPWITLFDRQSRRFQVTEYQFSVVQVVGDTVHLKLAAARLDAKFGLTQVLFFKIKSQDAKFEQANQSLSTEAAMLAEMNGDLKAKLMTLTKSFIRSLPDELLLGNSAA